MRHLTRVALLHKGERRAHTYARLGAVHEELLMHPEDAARAYREALVADPSHRPAMEALLALAERTGKSSEARAVAADLAIGCGPVDDIWT